MGEETVEARTDCRTCRAKDVDQAHVERCAIRTKARTDAIAHGRGDIGIHGARTDDLWAHMASRTGDPMVALDVTKVVIDLGWRPVIGRDTWTAPAPHQTEPQATTPRGGDDDGQ